jgi:hypothetical protein
MYHKNVSISPKAASENGVATGEFMSAIDVEIFTKTINIKTVFSTF